jgi:hypothetical protein
MSRVARRSSKASAIAAPPTTYISALTPRRSPQVVNRCKVLRQRSEIGIVAGISRHRRALRDGFGPRPIVASKRELVQELAYGMAEVLTATGAQRHAGKGFGEPLRNRGIRGEPVGACGESHCHE